MNRTHLDFFRLKFKSFTIQIDVSSSRGAILITEQKREKNFHLSISLGCVVWLIDQICDCLKAKEQFFFRKFTGGSNSYLFWIERLNTKELAT